jgi:hypothetical protein
MDLLTAVLVALLAVPMLRFLHLPPLWKLGAALLLLMWLVSTLLSTLGTALAAMAATPLPFVLGAGLLLTLILALGFYLGRSGLLGGDPFGPFD